MTSRSNSAYKSNFDNIFNAINTIKSQLSDDGKEGQVKVSGFCNPREHDFDCKVNSRANAVVDASDQDGVDKKGGKEK